MSPFRRSAASLLQLTSNGTLVGLLTSHLRSQRVGVSPNESRSWERSLAVLAQDLDDAGLTDVEVLVEYPMPLTSKRADVVLAGVHPKTGADSYVVVELKQWSNVRRSERSKALFDVAGMRSPQLHPGEQVHNYCQYLIDFIGALAGQPDALRGVAYLHNASDQNVAALLDLPPSSWNRVFTAQHRGAFLEYLKGRLSPTNGSAAADRLLTSTVRPSRHLLTHAARELTEQPQYVLLDEQRIAYELVLSAARRARTSNNKTAVIVEGGPGSGKSVIALALMAELARQGHSVLHATGSRSFTETLRKYATGKDRRTRELFKYFNSFMSAEPSSIEVLICDEAHRLRKNSVNRFTRKEDRATARPQLEELLAVARVPVFFLDEHQIVRPGELGSATQIADFARAAGLETDVVTLDGQFRCGGSVAYESWVLGLLELDGRQPFTWTGDGDRFDLHAVGSAGELEAELTSHHACGQSARITAGYCWQWSDPTSDGTLVPDVTVGDWSRPWNLRGERSVGGAPGSAWWATDPRGFGQVGCVYTAQGFEYDWSGVIIGPDLIARDGRLITKRSESRDPALKPKAVSDAEADRLIRNTYKVLLTRGMRGTTIYATDEETREFLAALIQQPNAYRPVAPGVFTDANITERSAEPAPVSVTSL